MLVRYWYRSLLITNSIPINAELNVKITLLTRLGLVSEGYEVWTKETIINCFLAHSILLLYAVKDFSLRLKRCCLIKGSTFNKVLPNWNRLVIKIYISA